MVLEVAEKEEEEAEKEEEEEWKRSDGEGWKVVDKKQEMTDSYESAEGDDDVDLWDNDNSSLSLYYHSAHGKDIVRDGIANLVSRWLR